MAEVTDEEGSRTNDVNESYPPMDRDMLLGLGRHNNNQEGHKWFRNLISERYDEYNSFHKSGRTRMAREIVQMIRDEDRRFYIREGNNWVEMNDDERARRKVAYGFRGHRQFLKRLHAKTLEVATSDRSCEPDQLGIY